MTTTYKDIAVQAAKDKDHLPIRAAGGAIGRNHICIIIPCHRVVGANHNLTGYGGGIDKKIQLLNLKALILISLKNLRYKKSPHIASFFYLFVFFSQTKFRYNITAESFMSGGCFSSRR